MKLNYFENISPNFLNIKFDNIWELYDSPSLIHIKGRDEEAIFISILLHGNETSGLLAVQNILKKIKELPRSIYLFIGNVAAARNNVRYLKGQEDYNRIWMEGDGPEFKIAAELLNILSNKKLFCAVDIHNNNGKNPFYACINRKDQSFYQLAGAFSEKMVYFETPKGTLSMAMANFCPSVTLECGPVGDLEGIDKCQNYLERLLFTEAIEHLADTENYKVYEVNAKMLVPNEIEIVIGNRVLESCLCLPKELESWNFLNKEKGSLFAYNGSESFTLDVLNVKGENVVDQYFSLNSGIISFKKNCIPSMLTSSPSIIKQDCLGYLMEEIEI